MRKIIEKERLCILLLIFAIINPYLFSQDGFSYSSPVENCSNQLMYEFRWQSNPLNLKSIEGWNVSLTFSPSRFLIKELNSVSFGVATDTFSFLNVGLGVNYLGSKLFSESSLFFSLQKRLFNWFSFATRFKTQILKVEDFGTKTHFNSDVFIQYEGFNNFSIAFNLINLFGTPDVSGEYKTTGLGFRFNPTINISSGFDVNFIVGYFTSYSVNFCVKVGEYINVEAIFRTLPQLFNFSTSVVLSQHLTIFLSVEYNNYLALSQTLGIMFKL